jgi:hypothetical protein
VVDYETNASLTTTWQYEDDAAHGLWLKSEQRPYNSWTWYRRTIGTNFVLAMMSGWVSDSP